MIAHQSPSSPPIGPAIRPRSRAAQSLRTVELLLMWEGVLRNERLREVLGVHFTHASRLMAEYAKQFPAQVTYDTAGKRYLANATFGPQLTDGTIDEYLSLLQGSSHSTDGPVVRTHLDLGQATPSAFRLLQRAAREGLGVQVEHRSLRHPEPVTKRIYPHALVEAGRRWHVRAFVEEAAAFQDLALTRLAKISLLALSRTDLSDPRNDKAWQSQVKVRIVPHPDLTEPQRKLVRDEYFPQASARVVTVRGALVPYVIHDLRAAIDPSTQKPPDFQLCVAGADALRRWLMPT